MTSLILHSSTKPKLTSMGIWVTLPFGVYKLPLYSINAKIKAEKWLGPIWKVKMEQSESIDQF
jgi:hypothetical protein